MEAIHSGADQAPPAGNGAALWLGRALAPQAEGDHGGAFVLLQRTAGLGRCVQRALDNDRTARRG